MSALTRCLPAVAAAALLSACGDVEKMLDRSASAKPAEMEIVTGADRLAGHWNCTNVGGRDTPNATETTQATVMRDGRVTLMAVVHEVDDGRQIELHEIALGSWELRGERIYWRYDSVRATRAILDGKEMDIGLANQWLQDEYRADPTKLENVSTLTLFKADLLESTETDGSTTKCVRRKA